MKRLREYTRVPLFLVAAIALSYAVANSHGASPHTASWIAAALAAAAFLGAIA